MKNCTLMAMFLSWAWLLASGSHAAEPVYSLGNPTFFGSGCPEGTMQVVTNPDGQSASILFSAFNAQTSSTVTRSRLTCNLAVPVTIKTGISLGIFKVDYRGYAYVPPVTGAYAKFDASYFFAGLTGPSVSKTFPPETDQNVLISNSLGVSSIVWSPCGMATTFRINAAVTSYKPSYNVEDTQFSVDTIDLSVQTGFRFFVTYQVCNGTAPVQGPAL